MLYFYKFITIYFYRGNLMFKCWRMDCTKIFDKSQNFLNHLKMHAELAEFSCSFCSKKFTQRGNMEKHMKRHEQPRLQERKTIKCLFCKSRFTEKYNCLVSPWEKQRLIFFCFHCFILKIKFYFWRFLNVWCASLAY